MKNLLIIFIIFLVFTVKGTERIDLGALNAVVTHVIRMIKNELLDLLAICRTAFSIPHGVNHADHMCDDCIERAEINPLRAFDCKNESCPGVEIG